MSVINTNITSLIAQKNLNASQSALTTAMERLSSGMRINSAKDDAAGQAIANRMSSQITGLGQAQRNANDGISVAQTAEGALNQINDNLQRVRELSVQAANGTNSEEDKASIQAEINQRLGEINRISEQTDFNGTKVLSEDQTLTIQVGANDGESISINLQQINAETLGLTGFNVDGTGETPNEAATSDDLILAGFAATGPANANGTTEYEKTTTTNNVAATSADVFSNLADGDTVTAAAGLNVGLGATTVTAFTYDSASNTFTYDAADVTDTDAAAYLTPTTGETTAATITIGGSSQDVLIDSDGNITAADDGAVLYLDVTGNLTKNNAGGDAAATLANVTTAVAGQAGDTIEVGGATFTGDGTTLDLTGASIGADQLRSLANVTGYTATGGLTVAAGTAAAGGAVTNGGAQYVQADGTIGAAATTTTTTTYYTHSNGNVTDDTGAQVYKEEDGDFTFSATTAGTATEDPLTVLDSALKQIDSLRSDLGAIQNRFDSAISNLSTTTTNLSAARSRIEDADYAVEVANMTKAQILQQAGTSVLAQANQIPQGVLSLLG